MNRSPPAWPEAAYLPAECALLGVQTGPECALLGVQAGPSETADAIAHAAIRRIFEAAIGPSCRRAEASNDGFR